jgi:outer membrane receptor protein involved in Fe transport
MEINGQIEFSTGPFQSGVPSPYGSSFTQVVPYANLLNLRLRGLESVLTFKPWAGSSLELNHTYEDVYSDNPNPSVDNVTPWNKVNLIARSELYFGFNASAQVGWAGGHYNYLADSQSSSWIPDQAVVNLRVGYKPTQDVELYVLGQNLAAEYRRESADGTAIPQLYACGASLAFGK